MDQKLVHLEDYYYLPDGRMVFTEAYHLKRGSCCGSGCLHCPYDGIDDVQNDAQNDANDLITLQCPFCFEKFQIGCTSQDGVKQEFVYDCEVCCRPINVEVDYTKGFAEVSARA